MILEVHIVSIDWRSPNQRLEKSHPLSAAEASSLYTRLASLSEMRSKRHSEKVH